MPEIWQPITTIPDLLVSSEGRVMVIPRIGYTPSGGERQYGGQPNVGQWDGKRYLFRRGNRTYKIARLICEGFHGPAPASKPYCIHIDEDARNNYASNLRWGTQKENLNMPKFIAYCQGRTGESNPFVKGRK